MTRSTLFPYTTLFRSDSTRRMSGKNLYRSLIFGRTDFTYLAVGEASSSDRKSTRLNSSHGYISYAVFCMKKKKDHDKTKMDTINLKLKPYHLSNITQA